MPRGPQLPFDRPASTTLTAAGYGYCTITCPSGVMWTVKTQTVSINSSPTVQPTVRIYRDSSPNPAKTLEGTYAGNFDASNTEVTLLAGQALTAEWTGGPAGAIATYYITGMQQEV